MKNTGFGKGRWNGAGGKQEEGETIETAAMRETQEELLVTPLELKKTAVIDFEFPHNPTWNQQVHTYLCENWQGNPSPGEELITPTWFNLGSIPYDKMWSSDRLWLPKVLQGCLVRAKIVFRGGDAVQESQVNVVETL